MFGSCNAWAQGIVGLLPKMIPLAVPPPFGTERCHEKGDRAKAEQAKEIISGGDIAQGPWGMRRESSHSLMKRCRFPCQLSPKLCTKGWLICRWMLTSSLHCLTVSLCRTFTLGTTFTANIAFWVQSSTFRTVPKEPLATRPKIFSCCCPLMGLMGNSGRKRLMN